MPEISIDTPDGPMTVYVAEPRGAAKGAVIVVQEAFGLTPHIRSVCDGLAAAGFTAAAPALFHRQPTQVFEYDDLQGAIPVMMTLDRAGIDTDLDAVQTYLRDAGFSDSRIGLVGFCMGGSVALHAAATRSLGASITFYGGGLAQGRFGFAPGIELAGEIAVPWRCLYGDLDQGIPVDDVEQVRVAAATRPVPTEVVRYANGQHGFNCDDRPSVYDADIATDARRRMVAWFDAHLR